MMKRPLTVICVVVFLSGVFCAAPRYFWPQDDVTSYETGDPSWEKSVLIASRSSDFKQAVLKRAVNSFIDEPVFMKIIGVDQLKKEHAEDYSAVVLINTCIAWGMDRRVNKFLNRLEDQSNIIVLTTSGDGEWVPKMKDRNFDAVSAASEEANIDETAEKIVSKVRALLFDGSSG
jgi:hypothetical protein